MAKYINADALVEVVKEAEQAGRLDRFSNGFRSQCFDEVLDIIKNAPTIDYLVPVGTGKKVKDEHSFKLFCSRCMHFVDSDDKFCKSCGVKLMEDENYCSECGAVMEADDIESSPAVDLVPVVRCKDCKECKARINGTFDCEFHYEALSDLNGYCNYGKAREERRRR